MDAAGQWLRTARDVLADLNAYPAAQLEVLQTELILAERDAGIGAAPDLGDRFEDLALQLTGDLGSGARVAAWRARRIFGDSPTAAALEIPLRGPRAMLDWRLQRCLQGTADDQHAEIQAVLEIMQRNSLTQHVRDWGPEISTLVETHASGHPAARTLRSHIEVAVRPNGSAGDLIEPLSVSELRVLAELQTGDSYLEIASRLFVSHNTVKSHVKSIYRKLDVHSRVAALERTRQLGLLESPASLQ